MCVLWCARLWLSRLAQRNLSLPGPPDSNVHRPHALGAFGTEHYGVGRWGGFIYKKTNSTLLAKGCLLCLFAEVAWSNFQPRPKRTIDRVLLYKMAARKRQFEPCSWGGGSSIEWLCFFLNTFLRTWMRTFDHLWMKMSKWLWMKKIQDSWQPTPFCRARVCGHTIL